MQNPTTQEGWLQVREPSSGRAFYVNLRTNTIQHNPPDNWVGAKKARRNGIVRACIVWVLVLVVCSILMIGYNNQLNTSLPQHTEIRTIETTNTTTANNNNSSGDERISFQLQRIHSNEWDHLDSRMSFLNHPNEQFVKTNKFYSCFKPFNGTRNMKFHKSQGPNVLDFTIHVQTDLNILFVGDSLAEQYAHYFEFVATSFDNNNSIANHHVILEVNPRHPLMIYLFAGVAKRRGSVAFWRITDFLRLSGSKRPLPNRGHGWSLEHLKKLLNHMTANQASFQGFDVVIQRIPHPWIKLKHVRLGALEETVRTIRELLHPKVLIFVTAHKNNNIIDKWTLYEIDEMNEKLKLFASNYDRGLDENDDFHVLVADMGYYVDQLIRANARILGYRYGLFEWSEEKVQWSSDKTFATTIPMACAKRIKPGPDVCMDRNFISVDGLHLCMEGIGARFYANLACQIQCAYNNSNTRREVQQCANHCDNHYMSMDPVDSSHFL